MPELEKLEQFNQELIRHGDEPAHAARRGEEIERVMTPEEYPLNNRVAGIKTNRSNVPGASPEPGAPASAPGSSTDDFLSNLDDLFSGPSAGTEPPADPSPGDGIDDLFDDDLLSGLPGKEAGEDSGAGLLDQGLDDIFGADFFGEPETPAKPAAKAAPAQKTSSPEEDIFGLSDISGMAEPDAPESGLDDFAVPPGLDDFSDLADLGDLGGVEEPEVDTLGLDALEEPSPEPAEPVSASVPPPASGDDFGLGDLGDLDAPVPEGEGEEDFLSDFSDDFIHNEPEDGYEAPAQGAAPESGADDFALPDEALDDAAAGLDEIEEVPSPDGFDDLNFDFLDGDEASAPADKPAAKAGAASSGAVSPDTFGMDDMPSFDDSIDLGGADDLGEDEFPSLEDNEFQQASANFDPSTLDKPSAGSADMAEPSMPDMPADFGANMDMDFGADSFSDEFDMSDFGKDFGLMEEVNEEAWKAPEAPSSAKESANAAAVVAEAEEEIQQATLHEQAANFEVSPQDLKRIQQTLSVMPLNLKIATEELLSKENVDFDSLRNLIAVLIRGESPKDIASIVSRISGKKIKIPAGYEKRTGIAFEQEKRTFSYMFRQTIFPVLRILALVVVVTALLIYAAYEFIYKPVYANSLYDKGLAAIAQKQYEQGNELFEQAYSYWPENDRYVQYAQAFRHMKQDYQATRKYQELLGMVNPQEKPRGKERMHREGLLDYADFAAWTRRDYGTAVSYLQRLVDKDKFDHVPVLFQGDVFLEWARYVKPKEEVMVVFNENVAQLEDQKGLLDLARYNYASLISKEGQTDELLSRMLRYFMRTGQENEVIKIKKVFLEDEKAKPDGAVIAELAGYLIDAAEGNLKAMEEPYRLLLKSLKGGFDQEPGLHYQLSRYYRALKDETEESKALDWAEKTFDRRIEDRPLDRFEQIQYIDTLIRQGERLYGPLYSGEEVMKAQSYLQNARDLYERSLETGHIPQKIPLLGRVYARLGDILYYNAGDLGGAWRQYSVARQHGYGVAPEDALIQIKPVEASFLSMSDAGIPHLSIPELIDANRDVSYKMGFIHYYLSWTQKPQTREQGLNQDLAVKEFMQSSGAVPLHNINLQYAIANTQYLRGDYDAAVSMYQQILERLQLERENLPELQIYEDQSQRELVEFLVRTHNNLGVAYYRLYRQGGPEGSEYRAQAMFHVGRALEIYENAARDPDTAIRAERKSQAYQNLRSMIQPRTQDDLSISWELRRDLSQSRFSRDLMTINQQSPHDQNTYP